MRVGALILAGVIVAALTTALVGFARGRQHQRACGVASSTMAVETPTGAIVHTPPATTTVCFP